jgi:hexosaminidase
MSPSDHTYFDMQYGPMPGWDGPIDVHAAYDWDPVGLLGKVLPGDILGVEAALWSTWLHSLADAETMLMPRLPALAEIGWSPRRTHSWADFRRRVGAQASVWHALGVSYYPSHEISWALASHRR